ncbi:MAG: hypothetical protein SVM80_05490 [Halobacteriota archaeon]|nr:hypothetical protein [Halobacteriota archaeon]
MEQMAFHRTPLKLENKISATMNEDQVLDEIKNRNLIENSDLIEYEKEKIWENL